MSTQETDQALQALEAAIDAANAALETAIRTANAASSAIAARTEDGVIEALNAIRDFAGERFTTVVFTLDRLAVKCHQQVLGFAVNACADEIRGRAVTDPLK